MSTPQGIQAGAPLVLGSRNVGSPVRTGWDAIQPPTGSTGGNYVHTQTDPQSTFVVNHQLGFRPAGVALFSPDYGTQFGAFSVRHIDNNSMLISMDQPTACIVVLS